ncbi:GATOR2 complex protein MIOS-B isoform X2 [Parasteatoda tepidariorum]|uniref:GATOR2 complex protein MIOS-B isoform X2 n=1 Tax=Parasteatoda tepidariorum TaxID=114398 RepID=UPI00077FBB1D|nr:GATOR complex protein MIOS-B isoform X2 [Parasteatoda tepidariorum]XP_042899420.1 GATOR complex protein MIOS-B isoform X2 [Parasteatoda tepidariorum]
MVISHWKEPTSKDVELIGREFVPKIIRACSVLSWNPIETNILLSGFDKSRGDNGIYLWDVTRSLYSSSTIDAVTNYDRRSVFSAYDSTNTTVKPVLELGLSENACSAYWFHKNPHIFVCGMSGKFLKLYDTRDSSKHPESTLTRATFNLCGDPEVEHRLASSFDCNFLLWDVRNFEKPVVTITRPKPIVKLAWSPTRSGLLAVLCKDSSSINLYDIQSPIGNDEVEPALVERIIQPFPSHSALSFAWHPTHENRMLGISQNNQLIDYKISDRITLNWSPTSEIVWTHGKKILQCVDSRDEFYLCLNDISVKMRKRASQGYGLKMQKVRSNAEFADDPNLTGVWMWLDLVKTYEVDTKKRHQKQPKYEGVYSVICGENDSSAFSQSEPRRVSWVGINSDCRIIKYTCEERERALQLCGWGADLDSVALYKFLERLENDGHYARAAAIAVFNLEIRRGIKILSKGALSRSHKSSCDLNAIAMALAGYTEERSGLWREVSGALKSQLTDSYLRAMFAFLTADNDAYEEILKDNKIVVQDRMAFACLYLNDKKLAEFLDGLRSRMTETGNLDGLLLTGLTNDGLFLIQRYVDTTGDVQTASLIILHTLPSQVCRDPRAQSWVENYRQLLDTWMLWTHRAMFDVNWYNKNTQISKPTQQIFVSCNFCRRSVSNFLQLRPISGSNRVPASSANRKITCCPGCRKPLPRCSLCLCHMGTAAGLPMQRQAENEERKKMTDFSNWLTWCQTCRHGGHSAHILEWFRNHNECPVTGCMCKCMSLDATGKHVTEVY